MKHFNSEQVLPELKISDLDPQISLYKNIESPIVFPKKSIYQKRKEEQQQLQSCSSQLYKLTNSILLDSNSVRQNNIRDQQDRQITVYGTSLSHQKLDYHNTQKSVIRNQPNYMQLTASSKYKNAKIVVKSNFTQ